MSGENEGQQADPTNQQTQADQQGSQQVESIPVERFNQVYAQMQEALKTVQSMQGVVAEQQATIANLQARPQQVVQQEPEDDLDPADAAKLDRRLNKALAPLLQRLDQIGGAVQQVRTDPELEFVNQQLEKINNPVITARVNELMTGLARNKKLGTVYTPKEVLRQVVGEFTLGQLQAGGAASQERAQFNGFGQPLTAGGGAKRKGGVQQQAQQMTASVLDKPLDELSMNDLQTIEVEMNKKYPNGIPF